MPTLDVDGARIALMEAGAGTPVVALHCSAGSKEQWQSLAELIGDRHRVLAPDLYGYGETDAWPGPTPMRLAHEAAIVGAVMDRCGGPVDLVGHSYGAAVALCVALAHRGRLASLTLIEPSAFALLRDGRAADLALRQEIGAVADAVTEAEAGGDGRGGMERFVDYWNGAGAWARLKPRVQSDLARRLGKVVLDFRALFADETRLAEYGGLDLPTLMLCGTQTRGPAGAVTRLLAETIPGARLETIAGAGHMSPVTHAEAVNAAIAAHLSGAR